MCRTIPNWQAMSSRLLGSRPVGERDQVWRESGLAELTFNQLTEFVRRHWQGIAIKKHGGGASKPDFGTLFRASQQCMDVNGFLSDMEHVRKHRNAIAHCKLSFSESDLGALFTTVEKWLVPL